MVLIEMNSWCDASGVPKLRRRPNSQFFINLEKVSIKVKEGSIGQWAGGIPKSLCFIVIFSNL